MIKTILTHASQFPQIGVNQQEPSVAIKPKKTKRNIILFLVFLILLLAIGAFVVLFFRLFDPLWNPFRPNPELVFFQSLDKTKNLKALRYKADLKVAVNEFEASAVIEGRLKDSQSSLKADISGSEIDFNGEAIIFPNKAYFKLLSLSFSGLDSFVSSDKLENVKSKWMEILGEDLEKVSGNESFIKALNGLNSAWREREMYNIKDEFEDEKINGTDVYHYKVVINNDKLEKKLRNILNEAIGKEDFEAFITKEILEEYLEEVMGKAGEIGLDVWIGKKDLYIYKVKMEKAVDKVSISLNAEFSDFDSVMFIEQPKDYEKVEELVEPLIDDYNQRQKESDIKKEMENLRDAAEEIYKANKSYVLLSCYNEAIKPLCKIIEEKAGKEPSIFRVKNNYCFHAKLNSEEYWCVDSTHSIKGVCSKSLTCPN